MARGPRCVSAASIRGRSPAPLWRACSPFGGRRALLLIGGRRALLLTSSVCRPTRLPAAAHEELEEPPISAPWSSLAFWSLAVSFVAELHAPLLLAHLARTVLLVLGPTVGALVLTTAPRVPLGLPLFDRTWLTLALGWPSAASG